MAQRKPPTSRSAPRKAGARPGGAKPGGSRTPGRSPKKPKSIVNQKQTPWGLISAAVAVVLFAAAVVIVVIATHKSSSDNASSGSTHTSVGGQSVDATDPYRHAELAAAKAISGVTYQIEGSHQHVEGHIAYDATPPVGGDHSQYWADCTGTVYSAPIANENAVHMLEHGAVWITYNAKTLPAAQLATLKKDVQGVDRLALSPYPDLDTPISLQAWGYQLKIDSTNASDPRIAKFISVLKDNPQTTPEDATCSQPTFKQHPSTFGHPLWVPAT